MEQVTIIGDTECPWDVEITAEAYAKLVNDPGASVMKRNGVHYQHRVFRLANLKSYELPAAMAAHLKGLGYAENTAERKARLDAEAAAQK